MLDTLPFLRQTQLLSTKKNLDLLMLQMDLNDSLFLSAQTMSADMTWPVLVLDGVLQVVVVSQLAADLRVHAGHHHIQC